MKIRTNIPETKYTKKVLEETEISRQKPGTYVPGLAAEYGRVFAALWWVHASIFDAWPRLAFQIFLLPINTASLGQKREQRAVG